MLGHLTATLTLSLFASTWAKALPQATGESPMPWAAVLNLSSHATSTKADPPEPSPSKIGEYAPWQVSTITGFYARKGTHEASYINFFFEDTNEGLGLSTQCSRFILPTSKDQLKDASAYVACQNNTVGFAFGGNEILIRRSWTDPA